MKADYYEIGNGTGAIDQTVQIMGDNIVRDSSDPMIIQTAHNAMRYAYPRSKKDHCDAIYRWCKEHLHYVNDPYDTEYIQTPRYMVVQYLTGNDPVTGDCDDMTSLVCALVRAIGILSGVRVISVNGRRWHHIYGLANIQGVAYSMDLTEDAFGFGDEHRYLMKKDIWF